MKNKEIIVTILESILQDEEIREYYFSYKHNMDCGTPVFTIDTFIQSLVYRFHWTMKEKMNLTKGDCQSITDLIHHDTLYLRNKNISLKQYNIAKSKEMRQQFYDTVEIAPLVKIVSKYQNKINACST